MNRMLILAAGAVLVLLALWHPAASPTAPAITNAPQAALDGHHSTRRGPAAARALHGSEVVVYVAGAVIRPGVYVLPEGARCNDAVQRAGGFRANADPDTVNLAERVTDGQEILVSRVGQAAARPSHARSKRRSRPAPAQSVDLNTADAATLASLPGIGNELASRIVEYRQLNGPFASIDELADVSGMTQRRIDALAPFARLHEAP